MSLKRLLTLSGVSLMLIALIHSSGPVLAQQAPLTDEQVSLIQKNCQSAKVTLERLHANDALLRVNRGQVYEAMSTRLMENFNSRLSSNKFDNRAAATVSGSYRSTLDSFRNSYRLYEEKLSSAIKIDCQVSPRLFHETLEEAREKRKLVHGEVVKLHMIMDDYRSAVDGFLIEFTRKSS